MRQAAIANGRTNTHDAGDALTTRATSPHTPARSAIHRPLLPRRGAPGRPGDDVGDDHAGDELLQVPDHREVGSPGRAVERAELQQRRAEPQRQRRCRVVARDRAARYVSAGSVQPIELDLDLERPVTPLIGLNTRSTMPCSYPRLARWCGKRWTDPRRDDDEHDNSPVITTMYGGSNHVARTKCAERDRAPRTGRRARNSSPKMNPLIPKNSRTPTSPRWRTVSKARCPVPSRIHVEVEMNATTSTIATKRYPSIAGGTRRSTSVARIARPAAHPRVGTLVAGEPIAAAFHLLGRNAEARVDRPLRQNLDR